MKPILIFVFLPALLLSAEGQAGNRDSTECAYDCCRPDGHAPLGIMSDHVHNKGTWGFSYSYMNMQMQGNRTGTTNLNTSQVLTDYLMAPDRMTMQMHMGMVMYGITDRLSAMAMFTYCQNTMTMTMLPSAMSMPGMNLGPTGNGNNSGGNSVSSGPGDSRLSVLYKLWDHHRQRLIAGMGLGIPSGSIQVNGPTLIGPNERLSYPMQIGSGTWDILPSLTYTGQSDDLSWGAAGDATIRTALNSEGYAPGNNYRCNVWVSYRFCKWCSASIRVEGVSTDKISGYDPSINILSANDPNANTSNSGGQLATSFLGLNFYTFSGALKGNRLLIECGAPLYQNLNGVQMPVRQTILAGWQFNF